MAYKNVIRRRLRARYSIETFLDVTYDKIKNRCNGYGHSRYKGVPLVSRKEFHKWAIEQGQLFVLFHNWNRYNHVRKFRPTVDRIDNTRGYEVHNMRWLTQSENSRLGATKGR